MLPIFMTWIVLFVLIAAFLRFSCKSFYADFAVALKEAQPLYSSAHCDVMCLSVLIPN